MFKILGYVWKYSLATDYGIGYTIKKGTRKELVSFPLLWMKG
jgi:hypothetical protein